MEDVGGGDAQGLGWIQAEAGVSPADDEATLHVPDRKPRQARGRGGRRICPSAPTQTGVSTPEWRQLRGHAQGHTICSWGHARPYPDACGPPHTNSLYTHTQKHTFPVSTSPSGTDVPPLSSGGTGCHQDNKVTLGREHKVLR